VVRSYSPDMSLNFYATPIMTLNNYLMEGLLPCPKFCKCVNAILLHKILTFPVCLAMMLEAGNWSIEAWLFTLAHGLYGQFYFTKNILFPYQNFQQLSSLGSQILLFVGLGVCFWSIGFYHIVTVKNIQPSITQTIAGLTLSFTGIFLEFCADVQKEITLEHKRGLITTGFFKYCRNPNYFGDTLMYVGLIVQASRGEFYYVPFLGFGFLFVQIMLPLMLIKDKSLSRYPEFAKYETHSGFFFPDVGAMFRDIYEFCFEIPSKSQENEADTPESQTRPKHVNKH